MVVDADTCHTCGYVSAHALCKAKARAAKGVIVAATSAAAQGLRLTTLPLCYHRAQVSFHDDVIAVLSHKCIQVWKLPDLTGRLRPPPRMAEPASNGNATTRLGKHRQTRAGREVLFASRPETAEMLQ